MNVDLSVKVGSIRLDTPVIPASGVWPYDADFWSGERVSYLGAICTKAISRAPRAGNKGARIWEAPAGVLNSIGLQNAGVEGFIKERLPMAAASGKPLIANVVMESIPETRTTLSLLQDAGGIAAAELNISCPNADGGGMAWGMEPKSAARAVAAARAVWRGELWVKMTPQTGCPDGVARAIEAEGADAVVAANTWLGMGMNMQTGRPAFERVVAGLSGPAVFPLALRLVWQVCGAVNIPVVGCGGVSTAEDCAAMMLAGASAVEVGSAFFRDLDTARLICSGLPEYVGRYGAESVSVLTGLGRR